MEGKRLDGGKPRFDLIPPEASLALASVLTVGAAKYAQRNWEKGMEWGRVIGPLERHLNKFKGGIDLDEETGLPHTWHMLANIVFLLTYEARCIGEDDRPKDTALAEMLGIEQ